MATGKAAGVPGTGKQRRPGAARASCRYETLTIGSMEVRVPLNAPQISEGATQASVEGLPMAKATSSGAVELTMWLHMKGAASPALM